jgi:hypothetical protein
MGYDAKRVSSPQEIRRVPAMTLPRQLKDLKRQVIRNIQRIVTPHMWNSGYLDDTPEKKYMRIFAFGEVNGSDTRSMGRVFNEDLTCLQGFYEHGTIDAVGGGCACTPFACYCLEDLLAIEQWLCNHFGIEIERAKAANEENKEHQRYMTLWYEGKAKLAWHEHLAKWRKERMVKA